jgi:hypothetical protein
MDEAWVLPRPAATRRRFTVLTGGAQAAPRPAATLKRSTVLMADGLALQRQQANAKENRFDDSDNQDQVHRTEIVLVMRAHPNCNLDRLAELSFEFDQSGKIIGCFGTIKDGGSMDHDYAGRGLAQFYETARRIITARQASATILQFPNGAIK